MLNEDRKPALGGAKPAEKAVRAPFQPLPPAGLRRRRVQRASVAAVVAPRVTSLPSPKPSPRWRAIATMVATIGTISALLAGMTIGLMRHRAVSNVNGDDERPFSLSGAWRQLEPFPGQPAAAGSQPASRKVEVSPDATAGVRPPDAPEPVSQEPAANVTIPPLPPLPESIEARPMEQPVPKPAVKAEDSSPADVDRATAEATASAPSTEAAAAADGGPRSLASPPQGEAPAGGTGPAVSEPTSPEKQKAEDGPSPFPPSPSHQMTPVAAPPPPAPDKAVSHATVAAPKPRKAASRSVDQDSDPPPRQSRPEPKPKPAAPRDAPTFERIMRDSP